MIINFKTSRNLLLGTAIGYNLQQIKTFILSFKTYNTVDKIILVVNQNTFNQTETFLKKYNVGVVIAENIFNPIINNIRYPFYLEAIETENYKNICISDVRDVVFQGNPFENLPEKFLYVFKEDPGYTLGTEPNNSFWMFLAYGEELFNRFRDEHIICGGTLIGSKLEIINYINFVINELTKIQNQSTQNFETIIFDQTPLNYLCYVYEYKPKELQIIDNGIIVGTIGLSVTTTIAKDLIEFNNGIVLVNGNKPAIIHQYDRNVILTEYFTNRYDSVQ